MIARLDPAKRCRRRARWTSAAAALALFACCGTESEPAAPPSEPALGPAQDDDERTARLRMVRYLREAYGFGDERALAALAAVPRHRFVPGSWSEYAYEDTPLPIGHDQTISQPYIVASMTAAAAVGPGDKVLEIGTGSGYQAAVLAAVGARVFTIEIVRPLGERAARVLAELGYDEVRTRIGDGYRGWPEQAPFDAIVVTAAPDHVPEPLRQQLKVGGRLVMPVGDRAQDLIRITRTPGGFETETLMGVRFVPMTGEAQRKDR